jgi:ABC-type nitrate/sulfonate/bicarbonate transport system permease component
VVHTTWAGLLDGSLLTAMGMSLGRTVGGLLLGGGLGFGLGLLLGLSNTCNRLLNPSLSALRQIAIFAWVPLITAWFGLGEPAKWVFVALAAFFPLFIATHRSVASLSPQLAEACSWSASPAPCSTPSDNASKRAPRAGDTHERTHHPYRQLQPRRQTVRGGRRQPGSHP